MSVATGTNSPGSFRLCGVPTDLMHVEPIAGEGPSAVSLNATPSEEKPAMKITLELARVLREVGR